MGTIGGIVVADLLIGGIIGRFFMPKTGEACPDGCPDCKTEEDKAVARAELAKLKEKVLQLEELL